MVRAGRRVANVLHLSGDWLQKAICMDQWDDGKSLSKAGSGKEGKEVLAAVGRSTTFRREKGRDPP